MVIGAAARSPLAIAAHDGNFWVSGMNGLIARSPDGGRTWQIVHHAPSGAALTRLSFPSANVIVASGSDDTALESDDGGAHWRKRVGASSPLFAAAVFTSNGAEYGAVRQTLANVFGLC